MKLTKISACVILAVFALSGCSAQKGSPVVPTAAQSLPSAQTQTQANTQSQAPTQILSAAPTQSPTAAKAKLQASDAAKAAADADDSGAPYFAAYEYDAENYLVSSYQAQQGPGSYSGGGNVYLVNKETGKVIANSDFDLNKVDFSKFMVVYSKLSGKIIE